MADTDFYNLNLYRRYPLLDERYTFSSSVLPYTDMLVDITVVLLAKSGYDPDNNTHRVYISGFGYDTNVPNIELYVKAPGSLVDGTYVVRADSTADFSIKSFQLIKAGKVLGYGFVVFGLSSNYALNSNLVSNKSSIDSTPDNYPWIERRCVQVLKGHYVENVTIANEPRTLSTACQTSSSGVGVSNDGSYIIAPHGENIIGDIAFSEGYNCTIATLVGSNALRFSAIKGSGAGEACTEIPRTAAEVAKLANGEPLDCAVRCNEVISNINGVEPTTTGVFNLIAGRGVEIVSGLNTITIRSRPELDACNTVQQQSSSSS